MSIHISAELTGGADAVRAVSDSSAGWLLIGTHRDVPTVDVVRKARALDAPPRVIVLIDHVSREGLGDLLTNGVDALLVRSVGPDELADAVTRVDKGERVVGTALMHLLVGFLGSTGDDSAAGSRHPEELLTRKEVEVLGRLAEGRSNKDIADALFVTPATVKTHLAHIYTKLGVTGRQEAVARAVELGLLR